MRKIMPVGILALVVILTFQALVSGEELKLSNNNSHDIAPQIHDGQVVWTRSTPGPDAEIYLWDGTIVKRLTNNDYYDGAPQIHNGQMVWQGGDLSNPDGMEIFLWNGSSTQQLTNNNYSDNGPQIHKGQVVWEHFNGAYEIHHWDGHVTKKIADSSMHSWPKIHNGIITWSSSIGSNNSEIHYWDGLTVNQLTYNVYFDFEPQIHNGQIVWYGNEGNNDAEIFFWDGSSIHQFTSNSYSDYMQDIHNGQVVWVGGNPGNLELFYWDGSSIRQLTNDHLSVQNPKIHNSQIVWRGKNSQIFYWGGSSEKQISNWGGQHPQIHEGKIVWSGGESEYYDEEIYYWDDAKDLTVHLIQIKNQAERGVPVSVKVVVRNAGDSSLQNFYVDIYKDLSLPPEPYQTGDLRFFVPELAPHEGIALTGQFTYDSYGYYNVYAQVDTDQNVNEENDADNIKGPEEVIIGLCECDFEPGDYDVDGSDLALFIGEQVSIPLEILSTDFGRNDCP